MEMGTVESENDEKNDVDNDCNSTNNDNIRCRGGATCVSGASSCGAKHASEGKLKTSKTTTCKNSNGFKLKSDNSDCDDTSRNRLYCKKCKTSACKVVCGPNRTEYLCEACFVLSCETRFRSYCRQNNSSNNYVSPRNKNNKSYPINNSVMEFGSEVVVAVSGSPSSMLALHFVLSRKMKVATTDDYNRRERGLRAFNVTVLHVDETALPIQPEGIADPDRVIQAIKSCVQKHGHQIRVVDGKKSHQMEGNDDSANIPNADENGDESERKNLIRKAVDIVCLPLQVLSHTTAWQSIPPTPSHQHLFALRVHAHRSKS